MGRPNKKTASAPASETLGARLKRLRLARGITQTALGSMVGVSQRVIAYYEGEGSPSPEMLVRIADALTVSTDELLGHRAPAADATSVATRHMRLLSQFKQLEQLPPQDRKTVLRMIDAFATKREKHRTED